jgi:hypothetical protein
VGNDSKGPTPARLFVNLRDPGGGEDILGHGATFAAVWAAPGIGQASGEAGWRTAKFQVYRSLEHHHGLRLTPAKPQLQNREMSARYRDRMMTPGNFPTPPERSEAVDRTSYPARLFFDPFAGAPPAAGQGPGSARFAERLAVEEPRPRKKGVVDEKVRRAASLNRVSRELERMLRDRAR